MAFSIPTLNDFVRTAENGMASAFYGSPTVLRKSVVKVLSRVFAGVAYLLALMLRRMWNNSFLVGCDVEALVDRGRDFDIPNKPESYARGRVLVYSSDNTQTVGQGTVLVTADGVEVEVAADTILEGGEDGTSVYVMAVDPGPVGNLAAATPLSFRDGSPEWVTESPAIDSEGMTGGIRTEVQVNGNTEYWGETVEEYRARLLARVRTQPCGGCAADYKGWAERFTGVSRCIVESNYPKAGSVRCVLVKFDDTDDVSVGSSTVADVRGYIDSDDRRPITADVDVVSCVSRPVSFVIDVYPNNTNVQGKVRTALKNALRSYAPGETVRAEELTAEIKGGSLAEKVAVYSMDGGGTVVLSRADAEMPVIGSIVWRDYGV